MVPNCDAMRCVATKSDAAAARRDPRADMMDLDLRRQQATAHDRQTENDGFRYATNDLHLDAHATEFTQPNATLTER